MKLTEKEVREAIDIKNMDKIYLDYAERDELIARMKKAGIIEEKHFYVILKEDELNSVNEWRYTFIQDNGTIDRANDIDLIKDLGALTMDEIKELDERYVPFAIEIQGENK